MPRRLPGRGAIRLAPALLIFFCALAGAQQYRWVDDKGRVQYTDTPPPAKAKGVQAKKFGEPPRAASDSGSSLQEAVKRSPVVLHTSPNCIAPCREARRLLDDRGVPFTEISAFDAASIEELKRTTGNTRIPSLKVGVEALVGFSADAWLAALDRARYPAARAAGPKASSLPPVRLYTNSGCGALCDEARSYLTSEKLPFTEVPVEDPARVEELRKLTGQPNVPVLTVGTFVQRGYDAALYARALESAGYPIGAK